MVRRNLDTSFLRNSCFRPIPVVTRQVARSAWFVAIQTPSFLENSVSRWIPVVTWQVARVRHGSSQFRHRVSWRNSVSRWIPVVTRQVARSGMVRRTLDTEFLEKLGVSLDPGCHVAGGQGPAWFVAIQTPSFLEKLGVSLNPGCHVAGGQGPAWFVDSDTEFLGETRCLAGARLSRGRWPGSGMVRRNSHRVLGETRCLAGARLSRGR